MGPIAPVLLGNSSIKWVTKAHVIGLTVDHKLTWDAHVMDAKKCFATKLDLLKRSKFLPKSVLRDFILRLSYPLLNTDQFCGGRVVTQTYLIQLKDFIVEHLESFLIYQETCLQKRCWPTIGGLVFSYIIKWIFLRSFLKHKTTVCLNCCLTIFIKKGVMHIHYGVENAYRYQDSKLDS